MLYYTSANNAYIDMGMLTLDYIQYYIHIWNVEEKGEEKLEQEAELYHKGNITTEGWRNY